MVKDIPWFTIASLICGTVLTVHGLWPGNNLIILALMGRAFSWMVDKAHEYGDAHKVEESP